MRLYHRSRFYLFKGIVKAKLISKFNYRNFNLKKFVILGENSNFFSKNNGKINIGEKTFFFDNVDVQSRGVINIGNNVQVNNYSRIVAMENITIGNDVTIAQFVTILDHDHNFILKEGKMILDGYKIAPIKIGNNVWLGDKVTILKGVNIGDNVVVSANSVVTKNIPSNSIYGGVPAKLIKVIE
jgi:maltose O-acetyltransferase